jgi:hypothetical protein
LRGVDVIYPGIHSGPQDCDGFVTVARWAEDAVSGQLHRAVPDPPNRLIG